MARTNSPPYHGLTTVGEYIVAWLGQSEWGAAIFDTATIAIPVLAGAAAYLVGGLAGGVAVGAVAAIGLSLVLAVPIGSNNLKIIAVPPVGPPVANTVNVNIGQGFNQFTTSFAGLIPQNQPPVITSAQLEILGGEATIILQGNNFQKTKRRTVTFQATQYQLVNGVSSPVSLKETATILSQSASEIKVKAPQMIALGLTDIYVTAMDGAGHSVRSNLVQITTTTQYAFVAMSAAGQVAVLDADPHSAKFNQLLGQIDLGPTRPYYVATTTDHTRAYVTLRAPEPRVAVLDTATLRVLDMKPAADGLQNIAILNAKGASPFEIAIDPSDQYAYVTDQNKYSDQKGRVYVIDINPYSLFYNQHVRTITVDNATEGLRGLDVSKDGRHLYVAAPNRPTSTLNSPKSRDVSRILVIDLDPAEPLSTGEKQARTPAKSARIRPPSASQLA